MPLWYICRASKFNGRPARQKSTRPPCQTRQCAKSASVQNLDNAVVIKLSKKLRNLFKLNSIKAKLKQTTTVANYRLAIHARVNRLDIGQWVNFSPPASKKKSNQYLQYLRQNLRHLTLFWILDYKKVTWTKHDSVFRSSQLEFVLNGCSLALSESFI